MKNNLNKKLYKLKISFDNFKLIPYKWTPQCGLPFILLEPFFPRIH